MQLNSVVLPAPLGPMRPTISPASMASETSRFASRPPKRLLEDSTWSRGAIRYAGGAEHGGGDAAGDHLVEAAVDADPFGRLLIVADRAKVEAQLRALDPRHENQRDGEERERRIVVAERLRRPRELQRERGRH